MTHGNGNPLPSPKPLKRALDVLQSGGNAVDAAIACALVQTAVDPQMCGIAGFGCMQLYLPRPRCPHDIGFSRPFAADYLPGHVGTSDRARG